VKRNWRKVGATTYEAEPAGRYYFKAQLKYGGTVIEGVQLTFLSQGIK
jgi:hypothetical protein